MPTFSQGQLRRFGALGYTVIPSGLSPAALAAVADEVERRVAEAPPPSDKRGFHFYWPSGLAPADPLIAPLVAAGMLERVAELTAPLEFVVPTAAQISLIVPPWPHRPGGPHIDGLTPPDPGGRPGTFTLLAGLMLTDQPETDMGNLWIWPGSHQVIAEYLRANGPEALMGIAHPPFAFAPPEQVVGRAGDLLLAHYLLGHNMGGNLANQTRKVLYFRLSTRGHRARWREAVCDPLLEFTPVRAAM
jgi:hypothetical protein